MAKIDFKQNLEELIKFAGSAASDGKYVLCVHNLLDALKIASSKEEKASVYKCFSDMFASIGNNVIAQNALFRACVEADKGGYYSLAYEKFFPYDGIIEDEELPPPDAEAILAYNDVYNFFITGQYDKGLDILCEIPPDIKCLDEVIGVLYDAIDSGKRVDLSAHAYKLLLLAGIFSMKSGDFVRVLLQGSDITRSLMADGVKFFVDEVEDKRILTDIGTAFLDEREYASAEICFEKVLEGCEIDEIALFYLSALNYFKDNFEKADKYWNTYKLCYSTFGAPVKAYENMFEKKIIPEYGKVPLISIKKDLENVLENEEYLTEDEYIRSAVNALSYAGEASMLNIFHKGITGEKMMNAVKKVLISPYVGDDRKKKILDELLKEDAEGRIAVSFEWKASIFDCVKFTARIKNRSVWHSVYERVSLGVICSKSFMPYRPNFLSASIKDYAKLCNENHVKAEEEDVPFLSTIMSAHYNEMAKKDTNIDWIYDIMPPLSSEELKKGLKKFPPEVLRF